MRKFPGLMLNIIVKSFSYCCLPMLALACVLIISPNTFAQGGPPLITDDPETPGNGHWEINIGYMIERGLNERIYQSPNIDINYGFTNHVQLKFEMPWLLMNRDG